MFYTFSDSVITEAMKLVANDFSEELLFFIKLNDIDIDEYHSTKEGEQWNLLKYACACLSTKCINMLLAQGARLDNLCAQSAKSYVNYLVNVFAAYISGKGLTYVLVNGMDAHVKIALVRLFHYGSLTREEETDDLYSLVNALKRMDGLLPREVYILLVTETAKIMLNKYRALLRQDSELFRKREISTY